MVSIDSVYQQVLAVMSKERRGELTPPHFNILANKAQNDIFEKTLYDYQTALREDLDSLPMLKEKIASFRKFNQTLSWNGSDGTQGSISSDVHLLESVYVNEIGGVRSVKVKLPRGSDLGDGQASQNPYLGLRAYYDGTGNISQGEDEYRIWFNKKDNVGVFGSVAETHRIFTVDPIFDREEVSENFVLWLNDNSPYHTAEYDSVEEGVKITYLQDSSLINSAESSSGTGFVISTAVVEKPTVGNVRYDEIDYEDWLNITSTISGKLKPTDSRPVYHRGTDTTLNFYP